MGGLGDALKVKELARVVLHATNQHAGNAVPFALNSRNNVFVTNRALALARADLNQRSGGVETCVVVKKKACSDVNRRSTGRAGVIFSFDVRIGIVLFGHSLELHAYRSYPRCRIWERTAKWSEGKALASTRILKRSAVGW